MYSYLEQENSLNNMDLLHEESLYFEPKIINYSKWSKFKRFISKKCVIITEIKDRKSYVESINVVTVKHTINRFCNRVFKSKNSGYQKFLSDEEKRFILPVNHCSMVEDFCR